MICLLWFFLFATSHAQLISPCPNVFKYEPNKSQKDTWHGTLTLVSDSEITGVWIRLIFDKPALQLGNSFGEVDVYSDKKEYLIKNSSHVLPANSPYNLNFYVRYNRDETPPQIKKVRLNGKTVCPENKATTEAPVMTIKLIESNVLSTTSDPLPVNNITVEPSTTSVPSTRSTTNKETDDFFQGDLALLNEKKPTTCGTVVVKLPPRPRPLINNYREITLEGEFPWHATVYIFDDISLSYICGASLISRYHVITTAHLVYKPRSQKPVNTRSLVIYSGKVYFNSFSNSGIQNRYVEKIIIHPKFIFGNKLNNIAVLKVAQPFEITIYVRPVCLWDEDTSLEAVINKRGTVVGWGYYENNQIREKLLVAEMPVVSRENCFNAYPQFYATYSSPKTFCGGFRNGTTCTGYRGSGFVLPTTQSNSNNPIWHLRGIVSTHARVRSGDGCDPSQYIIFTDIAKHLDWIRASLD